MKKRTILALASVGLGLSAIAEDSSPARWEKAIQAFESKDRESPPEKSGILFLGSSSIRGWDLTKYFPNQKDMLNRGFGGSQITDSIHFIRRIVYPYHPKAIVFYAGDNDIAKGKSADQVVADYQQFVGLVHKELPKTRVVFVAIKPSLKRWKLVDKMREANAKIKRWSEQDKRLGFVDIDTPMIGDDGKPKPELFVKDGLHLSPKGYALWSDLVRPHLKQSAQ